MALPILLPRQKTNLTKNKTAYVHRQCSNKKSLNKTVKAFVQKAGLEPARALRPIGF